MPRLSDTMEEGVIAAWHKNVGDTLASGDLLAEIETDKATMDFEAPEDGKLVYIGVEEGKGIPVGALLAILAEEGEEVNVDELVAAHSSSSNGSAATPAAEPVETPAPQPEPQVAVAAPVAVAQTVTTPAAPVTTDGRIKSLSLSQSHGQRTGHRPLHGRRYRRSWTDCQERHRKLPGPCPSTRGCPYDSSCAYHEWNWALMRN